MTMNQKELLLFFSGNTLVFRITPEGEKQWRTILQEYESSIGKLQTNDVYNIHMGDTCLYLSPLHFVGYQFRDVSPLEHSVLARAVNPFGGRVQ